MLRLLIVKCVVLVDRRAVNIIMTLNYLVSVEWSSRRGPAPSATEWRPSCSLPLQLLLY